jgi:hypothetical protein
MYAALQLCTHPLDNVRNNISRERERKEESRLGGKKVAFETEDGGV